MQNSINDFLKYTESQKEASLIIAKDNEDFLDIINVLKNNNYQQVNDLLDLFDYITKPSKVFLTIEEDFSKELYDFIIQYPTGQIQIYNNLRSQIITPIYNQVAVILVVKKEILQKAQASGLKILENIGLSYQN
jgi:site-specific DNA-adenine methylase